MMTGYYNRQIRLGVSDSQPIEIPEALSLGKAVYDRRTALGLSVAELALHAGMQTVYRVMMPLLTPAIFASTVLVFSSVVDDFVLVDLLNSNSSNTPMSVYIYSQQRGGNGGPALNALGTIMLAMSFVAALVGYFGYKWLTRGEREGNVVALAAIAGEG